VCSIADIETRRLRVVGQFFDSDGVRIHYTVEGQGEPVILVHGFAANADTNWRQPGITQVLARDYKVIALDNRGHGLSDKPLEPAKYGVEMVKDIIRLMDHLKIQKTHVIGYSMGGYITTKLITMYPDRLLSAAPCGAGWEEANNEPTLRERIASSIEGGNDFGPLLDAISPAGKAPSASFIRRINFIFWLRNSTQALGAVMRSLGDLAVTEDRLRANKVPTLMIIGNEDPLHPSMDRMKGIMANQEIVYIEGGNHLTALFDLKFIETLRAFLKKHSDPAPAEARTTQLLPNAA
jgi:pimeloyl-ACP methyl ester carboxylesterase